MPTSTTARRSLRRVRKPQLLAFFRTFDENLAELDDDAVLEHTLPEPFALAS